MDRYERLKTMIDSWLSDRPVMDENNDVDRLLALLLEEVREAIDASPEELESELADIGVFLFSIFRQLNKDLYDAMAEKMAFNLLRYSWLCFQDGDYDEAKTRAKAGENGLKEEFYKED